mmetsp:Transcript_257/g.588  ORF Transcript_257/g.588 Transcript_257/m.588 type:complete len:251 (-) Transcript_257:272-1024(-)
MHNNKWRKDFGDPLFLRRVPNVDGTGDRFELAIAKTPEVYNGDGCLAAITDPFRQPVRKTAVFDIVCQPCRRLGADAEEPPGFGNICSIWREDGCTLKVVLALICPPRQLVYAPSLEVGTSPGRADLITRGMPATCHQPVDEPQFLPNNSTLWVFLTQGFLTVAPPLLATHTPGCAVSWHSNVGTLLSGGVLRHALGHQPLQVQCICTSDAPQHVANISLTIRVIDFTSPVVNFFQICARMPTSMVFRFA